MQYFDIIRRNLEGNRLRTMISDFTSNVIRSSERTVEPVLVRKEAPSNEINSPNSPVRSNRLLIFEDLRKVQQRDEQVVSAEEAAEFFDNLKKLSAEMCMGKMSQPLLSVAEQPVKEDLNALYVRGTAMGLQHIDPIYYMQDAQYKIMKFQLQLCCSKEDIQQRVGELLSNTCVATSFQKDIVTRNGSLLLQSTSNLAGTDELVNSTLAKLTQFRQNGRLAWVAYQQKADNIKQLAHHRKQLESKLNFLKGFRRSTARVIILPALTNDSDWKQAVKLVETSLNNLKRLSSSQESLVTSRISCLNNFKQRCLERLSSVAKWSTAQFLRYLSPSSTEIDPVSFTAVWIYLRPFDQEVCSKAIGAASKCLLAQFEAKLCDNNRDRVNIVKAVLTPITHILKKLDRLQKHLKSPSQTTTIDRKTANAFKEDCAVINEQCFEPSKQELLRSILSLIRLKLPMNDTAINQYLAGTLFPVVIQLSPNADTAQALDELRQSLLPQ